jgi:hypothetical protein
VLIDEVSAAADRDKLTAAGASGYQVTLGDSAQISIPPVIQITGTGGNAEAAVHSVRLVATALLHDLNGLQSSQHVQSKYMINGVEYVTPTAAAKVSSGSLRVAVGVVAIGLIALLMAVSMAQGREEHGRSRRARRSAHREGARHEPAESAPDFSRADLPVSSGDNRPMTRVGNNYPAPPPRAPGRQPIDSGNWHGGQNG